MVVISVELVSTTSSSIPASCCYPRIENSDEILVGALLGNLSEVIPTLISLLLSPSDHRQPLFTAGRSRPLHAFTTDTMSTKPLHKLSASEVAELTRSGQITVVE